MPIALSRPLLINFLLGLFACCILIFSFIHESQAQVNKNLGMNNSSVTTPVRDQTSKQVPVHSNYQLPAPGILPSNPLYVFKMIRDRVGLTLTLDSDQHALLLLHYADKRIAAAQMLANIGHQDQALETAIKAETYLSRAINESPKISKSLLPIWFDNLKQAILKHEEIIEDIQLITQGEGKNQLNRLHQNLDVYRNQIVSLSGQPFGYSRPENNVPVMSPASPSAAPKSREIPYI